MYAHTVIEILYYLAFDNNKSKILAIKYPLVKYFQELGVCQFLKKIKNIHFCDYHYHHNNIIVYMVVIICLFSR
jgi:hypothetical protein